MPFLARYNSKIIGYIIGVPLEHFKLESWSRYDTNLDKKNTLYTYAFIIEKKYRKIGGYGKTLKMIYLNWSKKKGYKYVSGHVKQGAAKSFGENIEIVKRAKVRQAKLYYLRELRGKAARLKELKPVRSSTKTKKAPKRGKKAKAAKASS